MNNSKEDPVLSILDGHNFHTRNLEFIRLAKANYVTVLPSYTSRKMQTMDKSVMGHLLFRSEEFRSFMRQNQRALNQFDVAKIVDRAYPNIHSGAYA